MQGHRDRDTSAGKLEKLRTPEKLGTQTEALTETRNTATEAPGSKHCTLTQARDNHSTRLPTTTVHDDRMPIQCADTMAEAKVDARHSGASGGADEDARRDRAHHRNTGGAHGEQYVAVYC